MLFWMGWHFELLMCCKSGLFNSNFESLKIVSLIAHSVLVLRKEGGKRFG